MDFKPYAEVVLPPEKGTGIRREGKAGGRSRKEVADPREVQRDGDAILTDGAVEVAANDGMRTFVLGGKKRDASRRGRSVADAAPAPVVETTTPATSDAEAFDDGDVGDVGDVIAPIAPIAATIDAAPAPAAAASAVPAAPVASRPRARRRVCAGPCDFIFAYDGRFVGHYRAARRITDKTAFKRIALRLAEGLPDFDPDALEVFKPVPIRFEGAAFEPEEVEGFEIFG